MRSRPPLCLILILASSSSLPSAEIPAPNNAPIPAKLQRYARWLIRNRDTNSDGNLQPHELGRAAESFQRIDRNQDQLVTPDEIAADAWEYALKRTNSGILSALREADTPTAPMPHSEKKNRDTRFYVPLNRLPEGTPDWFLARDLDGDAQLSINEYAPAEDRGIDLSEFRRLDANGDGMLTAVESLERKSSKPAPEPGKP